jgi:hypothetical protein
MDMDIDARLLRMERALRRQKIVVAMLLLLAPVSALTTYGVMRRWPEGERGPAFVKAWFDRGPGKHLVTAQRLLLVDSEGVTRAKLACETDGVGLRLLDGNERLRASLDVTTAGPGLALYDDGGRVRAVLQVGREGPFLAVTDPHGAELFAAPAAAIANTAPGTPSDSTEK